MDRADSFLEDEMLEPLERSIRPARVSSYVPPAIEPKLIALGNRLSARRQPIAVSIGDVIIELMPVGLGGLGRSDPHAERMQLWFHIDGRPLVLQMSKGLHEHLLARIDPELLAADIDQELLPLLLESCIEDSLFRAEAALGRRIELVAIKQGAALNVVGLDVALDISVDGDKVGIASLRTSREDARRLAELMTSRPQAARHYGGLKVELSMRAAAIWLDLGTFQTLKTGDVLLAEDDASRWEQMAATAGERWLFPIEMTRSGPAVRATLRYADQHDQEAWMMVETRETALSDDMMTDFLKRESKPERRQPEGDTSQDAGIATDQEAQPAGAAFDDLPIKLVFELGRLDVPLGQLQDIGPGHVFELDRPLGEAVEIHAAGRRIGQGEVVRIEDQIGVRITRLFGQAKA